MTMARDALDEALDLLASGKAKVKTTMATRLPTRFKGTTAALARGVRGNKYGAVKTTVDGIVFASKAEARRYQQLRLLEKAGKISNLEMQKRIDLHGSNHHKVCVYVADFAYLDRESGASVYEDVKGVETPLFKLKAKLFYAEMGVEIVRIRA